MSSNTNMSWRNTGQDKILNVLLLFYNDALKVIDHGDPKLDLAFVNFILI